METIIGSMQKRADYNKVHDKVHKNLSDYVRFLYTYGSDRPEEMRRPK
jgi:hypothetical protein